MASTALAVASLVVSLVGAGVSYNAQIQSGKAQNKLAELNMVNQLATSRQAGQLARLDAMTQEQLALATKKGHEITAARLEEQAAADARISEENARRTREEGSRYVSASRVALAESGLVDTTGSPWELLRQQIVDTETQAQELKFQDEINRRSLFQQAAGARRDASLSEMDAIRHSAAASAASSGARIQGIQARMDAANVRTGVRGDKLAALGGLISSTTSSVGTYYQRRQQTPSARQSVG